MIEDLELIALQKLASISLPGKTWSKIEDGLIHIGQLLFLPTPYEDDAIKIIDFSKNASGIVTPTIRGPNFAKDFRIRAGKLDSAGNPLESTEEIIANTAKCRPCIVLGFSDPRIADSLPAGAERNSAARAFPLTYLLAPLYSCAPHKTTAFGAITTLRTKCFYYPQFFHIPGDTRADSVTQDSILRLDKIFWSQLKYSVGAEKIKLKAEIISLIKNRLMNLYKNETSAGDKKHSDIAEIMRSKLPIELA